MASVLAGAVACLKKAGCILALVGAGTIAYAAMAIVPVTASSPSTAPQSMNTGDVAPSPSPLPSPSPSAASGKSGARKFSASPVKPLWVDLTPQQQSALAPLSVEWDKLDLTHKKKWLAISRKYPSLKPDQQVRLQKRMRDWIKLTPQQRHVARESYARAKKLDPGQKSAEWQHYQQLPEEQKKKLANDAAAKKRVTNLPSASQNKGRVTSPPKSAPKPKTAQPVSPSMPNQPATPAPLQPAN